MMGWMAPLRHLSAKRRSDQISSEWEPSMGEVTTIGLDLAKHVFQVHGVDAEGATVLRKQLRRAQVLAREPVGTPPPTLGECSHSGLARRLVTARRVRQLRQLPRIDP